MIRVYLLALAFTLFGCGADYPIGDSTGSQVNRLGAEVSVDENDYLDKGEVAILNEICSSLKAKELLFESNVVNKEVILSYTSKLKPCGSTISNDLQVGLRLVRNGSSILFSWVSGSREFFVDYETSQSGYFADFCERNTADTQVKRYSRKGNSAIWVRLFDRQENYCPNMSGTKCAVFATGQEQSSGKFLIRQMESLTIQTESGDTQGLVRARARESKVFCENDKTFLSTTFAGLNSSGPDPL